MARHRGVTLIELIIVLVLFSFIVVAGSLANLGDFQASDYRADRDILIDALLYARSEALSGRCSAEGCRFASPHGIHIDTRSITVFEGGSFADRNISIDRSFPRASNALLSGKTDILFLPGSGYTSADAYIAFETHPGFVIMISPKGRISTHLNP